MRLFALTRYTRLAASSRLRFFQYLPFLEDAGFDIDCAALFPEEYLTEFYEEGRRKPLRLISSYLGRLMSLLTVSRYDLLWIEKELFPYLPSWFEEWLARFRVPIVTDFDDATFHTYDLSHSFLVRALLGHKIDRLMRYSSTVVAGNQYLATRAIEAGCKSVHILPTVVDLCRYPAKKHEPNPKRIVVGWIGSPTSAAYMYDVLPALEAAARIDHRIELRIIGGVALRSEDLRIVNVAWQEDTEGTELLECDIGIMPLRDTPWERGKCGYKLIQYMASGLPVIASPVGVNCEIVTNEMSGILASTRAEWTAAILSLAANQERRGRMGTVGRARVTEHYSLTTAGPALCAILRSAARR